MITTVVCDAEVSELADEQDSGSCERYAREGSSPFFRMTESRRQKLLGFFWFIRQEGIYLWQNM